MCLSLSLAPVPICRKKLVFLTQPLCQDSLLSCGMAGVFSWGHLGQVECFSNELSLPRTGHGPSWQQA